MDSEKEVLHDQVIEVARVLYNDLKLTATYKHCLEKVAEARITDYKYEIVELVGGECELVILEQSSDPCIKSIIFEPIRCIFEVTYSNGEIRWVNKKEAESLIEANNKWFLSKI